MIKKLVLSDTISKTASIHRGLYWKTDENRQVYKCDLPEGAAEELENASPSASASLVLPFSFWVINTADNEASGTLGLDSDS